MNRELSLSERFMVAVCLAVMVCSVSATMNSVSLYRGDMIAVQSSILHRQPFSSSDGQVMDMPEFRGRILMPVLLGASQRLAGGSPELWFSMWRLITALLLFVIVLQLAPGPWHWRVAGAGLIAYLLVLCWSEHPTDFPDVAFTIGFCALALADRWYSLLLLTLLAALNRESAAFAGVIWIGVRSVPATAADRLIQFGKGATLSVAAYTTVLALRYAFSVPTEGQWLQTFALPRLPQLVREFVEHPTPSGWPVLLAASAAPLFWLTWRLRHVRTRDEDGLVLAGAVVVAITLCFGLINEIRVFLPPFAILAFAAIHTGDRVAGDSQV